MAKSINLVYLHGFLGSPRDFALVENELKAKGFQVNSWGPDYFNPGPCSAAHEYPDWTTNFLTEVETRFTPDQPLVLMGYSLGARLALHAFLRAPKRFQRLVLVSANPGVIFISQEERRKWEVEWANRFRELPWAESFQLWNQQEVFFQTTARVPEGKMKADLVADSLGRWSILKHDYTLEDLSKLPPSTEWWFGEKDLKFMRVKEELERLHVPGQYRVVQRAGHRLTLDVPELLADSLAQGGIK